MDQVAEVQQLESEQRMLEQYLQHPVTLEMVQHLEEAEETLLAVILNNPVTNIETFLAREQAFGELRRLRWTKSLLRESLEEVKVKLKEIK